MLFLALKEYLDGVAAITALVPAEKIVPVAILKGTAKPYVIFSRVATIDNQDLAGSTTYAEVDSIKFDIITDTPYEGQLIAEQIRLNLDGYQQQNMGTTTPIYIGSVKKRSGFSYSEASETADDAYDFHTVRPYDFGYIQADNVV